MIQPPTIRDLSDNFVPLAHILSPRALLDSVAASMGAPFRLGMPHMDMDGASRGWLLQEACHVHWGQIAAQIGVWPTEFRDRSGARVLAPVVACTVCGDASKFHEDDICRLHVAVRPRAANGWRSQLDLINEQGATVKAEIVTRFARRNGTSNADIGPADLETQFHPDFSSKMAHRAAMICRLGRVDRDKAEADQNPPHYTIPIERNAHTNGVGMVYFAKIHDIFAEIDRKTVPFLVSCWPMKDRRVHFFGNLDAGDTLDVTARASTQAVYPNAVVIVRSHAKRASDGVVVAVAESVFSH